MGTGSKVFSVIFRISELCSSVIVAALLGRFFYLWHLAPDGSVDGRLVYTEVISCLGVVLSIFLIPPFKYSFYAWPLDSLLVICSIVAFGLLADLSTTCSTSWYWNTWGYYWGRVWTVGPRFGIGFDIINGAGCGSWRAILAFLFIGAMSWFLSTVLGMFVWLEIRAGHETHRTRAIKEKIMNKNQSQVDPENPH